MANRTTLVKSNIKLQSDLNRLSNSLSCLKWALSLSNEELKSTSALNQKIVLEILLEITSNAGIELPKPNLDADVDYCFSWTLEDVTISFEIDEDGKVEWKCLFSQRAKDEKGTFDGTKNSKKRRKAIKKIANILKSEK